MDNWTDDVLRSGLAFDYIMRSSLPVIVTLDEQHSWGQDIVISNISSENAAVKTKIIDACSGEIVFKGEAISPTNSVKRIGKIPLMYSDKGMLFIDYTVNGEKQFNTYLYGMPPFDFAFYKEIMINSKLLI